MYQLFEKYFPNVVQLKQEFLQSTWETLYMVFWTALIAGVLGVLLGVVLVSTGPSGVLKNPPLYSVLEKIINVCRSIPFIIMLALIQPLTRILAGTTIGTTAALVPLVIGVIPFFARQIENALLEVDPGVIEAAEAMGTSPLGAGGLGNLAITRGYNRFQTDVTFMATLIILIMVFISQAISNQLIKKTSH